jgi:hypothetical protein
MSWRSYGLQAYVLLLLALSSSGCRLAGGIFKAGMWVGVLMVVLVVGLLFMFFGRSSS